MLNQGSLKVSEILKSAAPNVSEMIGATIAFRHENRNLYPNLYVGTVTAYEEDKHGDAWLTVKSPSFNIQKRIHESYMKGYVRNQPVPALAIKKTTAA